VIRLVNNFYIADANLTKSFADITSSNLENAPPSAVAHVDELPVYHEEEVYMEMEKREEFKNNQVEYGNNEQLVKEEKGKFIIEKSRQKIPTNLFPKIEMDTLPDEELEKVLEDEDKVIEKDRDIQHTDTNQDKDALAVRLHTFDRDHNGVITIFDTISGKIY
jgi:hypothetical protein